MMQAVNVEYKRYLFTTDKSLMQPAAIHKWLSENSYWVKDIAFEEVQRTFANSFCIGILKDGEQAGYARLTTDYTLFAYLADVYVKEEHRGKGLGKEMMRILFSLDWVKGLSRVMLATSDAHGLYKQVGFTGLQTPEKLMEIIRPYNYKRQT